MATMRCGPTHVHLVLDNSEELVPRALSMLPIGCKWKYYNITDAIRAYEKLMHEHNVEYAQQTWDGMQSHFKVTRGHERAEKM